MLTIIRTPVHSPQVTQIIGQNLWMKGIKVPNSMFEQISQKTHGIWLPVEDENWNASVASDWMIVENFLVVSQYCVVWFPQNTGGQKKGTTTSFAFVLHQQIFMSASTLFVTTKMHITKTSPKIVVMLLARWLLPNTRQNKKYCKQFCRHIHLEIGQAFSSSIVLSAVNLRCKVCFEREYIDWGVCSLWDVVVFETWTHKKQIFHSIYLKALLVCIYSTYM